MIKHRLVFFFLLMSFGTYAEMQSCELKSFKRIVKINKIQDDKIIKSTDCPEMISESFKNLIENANGTLNSVFLKRYFEQESQYLVDVYPTIIQVSDIKDLIKSSLGKNRLVVKKVNSLLAQSSLNIDHDKEIKVQCHNCNSPGAKDLALLIGKSKHWLTAEIYIKKEVFKLIKNINNLSQKLQESDFKKVTIVEKGQKRFFHDISNIQFYRLNRFMQKGDILGSHDISPKNIVRYGDKIKVNIQGPNVALSTIAIAKSNARFGETIKLQNPKSKKIITARIIDYNRAEIKL